MKFNSNRVLHINVESLITITFLPRGGGSPWRPARRASRRFLHPRRKGTRHTPPYAAVRCPSRWSRSGAAPRRWRCSTALWLGPVESFAHHVIGCRVAQGTTVCNALDYKAWKVLQDQEGVARHVKTCRLTRDTRVHNMRWMKWREIYASPYPWRSAALRGTRARTQASPAARG